VGGRVRVGIEAELGIEVELEIEELRAGLRRELGSSSIHCASR
jgi:hypothetical protein